MSRLLPPCFIAIALVVSLGHQAPAEEKPAANEKLKALLQDRLDTTNKAHEMAIQMYTQGVGSYTQVHEAQVAVLGAQLDLCDTKAGRVKVLEVMLTQAKEWEKMVAKRHDAGMANAIEPLNAKAYRLEREIALERAKAEK
jgi:outer membrane protein TolC